MSFDASSKLTLCSSVLRCFFLFGYCNSQTNSTIVISGFGRPFAAIDCNISSNSSLIHSFDTCFFETTDVLVGVHVDGSRPDLVYGRFHQMLCCAHTQFESEKASCGSYSGHVTSSGRHSSAKGNAIFCYSSSIFSRP
jgi:hypothetical protein